MSLHSQTDPAIDRREPQIHFARGEISLFIRHRPGLTATAIINQIEEYKALLRNVPDLGFDQPLAIYLTPERVVTFDRSKFARERTDDGQAYSLVFIAIPAIYDEQIALRYIDLLRLRFSEHGLDRHATFAFQSVTPNWLAGGAGENNGSGGPGARPVGPPRLGGGACAPRPPPCPSHSAAASPWHSVANAPTSSSSTPRHASSTCAEPTGNGSKRHCAAAATTTSCWMR